MENISEPDTFIGKIAKVGGGSLMVIIPARNAQFSGLKETDTIKVWYKKVTPAKEETKEE